jgi:AraC-like DNA-binding protein
MAKTATYPAERNNALSEARQELARRIALHALTAGEHATAIPGLQLFRRIKPTSCYRAMYEPSLTVFTQGRKSINMGGNVYLCDGSSFLISSVDVPVQSQIVEASEETPLLSMLFRLDMQAVREIMSRDDLPDPAMSPQQKALAVGKNTVGLLTSCMRLIELLDTPQDIPFLSQLAQREIIYRILCTQQGARLRAIATSGDLSQRTARAVSWLRENYTQPLRIEELAEIARMGISTLHHQFRALTAMSPLQYQKQIRLQTARQRMLMDGMDATSAAYEVGYESVSQFNREYSRFFGLPPIRDVKALRDHSHLSAMDSV